MSELIPLLRSRVAARQQVGLLRRRVSRSGPQQPEVQLDTGGFLSFCSNDYLGLANHPEVIRAFQMAADRYGVGSGASHMISGHCSAHHALEEELAEFTGRDSALLFSTGYMANIGTINALINEGDLVLQDSLNHASLLDGGWLSRGRSIRYAHGNLAALEEKLAADGARHQLVVSDGLFSMDGDLAPLPGLVELCRRYGAWLMIDDAHGLGSIGEQGRGIVEMLAGDGTSLIGQEEVPILVGTLGKAFGCSGAFVAGDENLIDYLVQFARPYIYSTALPPAIAEAARTSLRLSQSEGWRRRHLAHLVALFRRSMSDMGYTLTDSSSPVQPVIFGEAAVASEASRLLAAEGLHITAIRPPTVPAGTSRLRITLTAAHSERQLNRLLDALEKLAPILVPEPAERSGAGTKDDAGEAGAETLR